MSLRLIALLTLSLTPTFLQAHSYKGHSLDKCDDLLLKRKVNKGSLFSAIPLDQLHRWWSAVLKKAEDAYPALNFESAFDLNIPLIKIGKHWSFADYEKIESMALIPPPTSFSLKFEVVQEWRTVALALTEIPADWREAVNAARRRIDEEVFQQKNPYDHTFDPRIVLATANPKAAPQDAAKQLWEFHEWLKAEQPPQNSRIVLHEHTVARLFLRGATLSPVRKSMGSRLETIETLLNAHLHGRPPLPLDSDR